MSKVTTGKNRRYDRPNKNLVRSHQLHPTTKGVAKSALFIITKDCLCIQEAYQRGTIDKDTVLHIVNTSGRELKQAAIYLKRFLKFKDIRPYRKRVEELKIDFEVDFAFVDTCSCLSTKFAEWIERSLWPHITPGGAVSFTFCGMIRHPKAKPPTIDNGVSDDFYISNFRLDNSKDRDVVSMLRVLHNTCGFKMEAGLYKEQGRAQKMLASRHEKTLMPVRTGL